MTCLLAAVLLASVVGLAQQPGSPVARANAPGQVTFSETIAPIVYAHCVTCHRAGEAAPFPLITYEDVAKRGALIARVTESRYMPPWHAAAGHGEFVGERRLTDQQIASIAAWVKQGLPRGDETKLPRLPEFPTDGWRLGQPDLVLEMPVGFEVPASGPDVFRNFVIPTRLTEDKWVRGVEFHPGARKVVHHALFAAVGGGSLAALDGADGRPGFGGLSAVGIVGNQQQSTGLGGWAVGATPRMLPEGLAAQLPRGSDFLLQLHFHPSGKPETEKSLIGIYFTDAPPTRNVMTIGLPDLFGFGWGIDIPPGEKNYTITDSFTLPADVKVYSASAHAHYLARQMKVTATLPDGSTKPLIWIDDWDFNWQDTYVYKEPFTLAKGTRLDATLTYDNSADNPRNPINPPRRALWGEQSFDEMGSIGFTVQVLNDGEAAALEQALGVRLKTTIAAANKNGTLARYLARTKRERGPRQQLTVFDRTGTVVSRIGEPGLYAQPAFSPDGNRIVTIRTEPETGVQDVWVFDVATGVGRAITSDEAVDFAPLWSADGRWIAYSSVRDNTHTVFRRAAEGTGNEEQLYRHNTGNAVILTDWSRDGRFMTFWSGQGMFIVPVTTGAAVTNANPTPIPVEDGRGGRFSPDGRSFAFTAAEGAQPGRFHVFVRPFDGSAPAAGGAAPRRISQSNAIGGIAWRSDGREMYFLSQPPPAQMVMAVDVSASGDSSTPRVLFQLPAGIGVPAQLSSISSPDGQRFVFAVNLPQRPAAAAR
jgi:Tol biopolymer transport system component/mono/diheme cytochrome c family protein